MATGQTDFSEFDTGTFASLDLGIDHPDWTRKWYALDTTWVIAERSLSWGGKILRCQTNFPNPNERKFLAWDNIGTVGDVEVLVRCRHSYLYKFNTVYCLALKGGGIHTDRYGYTFEVAYDNHILRKWTGGTSYTDLLFSPDHPSLFTDTNEWFYWRIRISGPDIKIKGWKEPPEPAAWTYEFSDTETIADGWVALGGYYPLDTAEFDFFSYGTGGDAAPSPIVAPIIYEEKAQHRQPWGYFVSFQHRQPWGERYYADYQHRQPWAELTYTPFDFQHRQPWREYIEVQHRQPWREWEYKDFQHRQPWAELTYTPFDFQHRQPWREYIEVQHRQPITYAYDIPFDFQHRQPWAELTYTPFDFQHRQPWVEISDTYQAFTGEIYMTVSGKRVELAEAALSADEDSPYWQASIRLSNLHDYARFPRNTAFTLHFYGTDYSLISDTRNLSREISADGQLLDAATITALSPLSIKASPRAESIERVWDMATLARSIVEDLIGAGTWETVNWSITANLFGVSSIAPLEAARQITDAVGAIILSNPDGSIVIRPLYPVSVPNYETASPVVTLTSQDIYSVSENISAREYWNAVGIGNNEQSINQDRLEFVADQENGLSGQLRAYPSPWDSNVTISTTRDGVTLSRIGPTGRDETETIEIVEGRGSVQYPIDTVRSLDYHDNHLGGVSFTGSEITTAIAGYSLLEITYRTRYIAYSALVTTEQLAQMLLERP